MLVRRGPRGIVQELLRGHRFVVATLAAVLLVSLSSTGYALVVAQSRVERLQDVVYDVRVVQQGMLDQETGLRGWLVTDDEEYLEPYVAGRRQGAEGAAGLTRALSDDDTDRLAPLLVETLVRRDAWQSWAAETRAAGTDVRLEPVFAEGKRLFDAYRVADAASTGEAVAMREAALSGERSALTLGLVATLSLVLAAGVLVVVRRRELHDRMVEPLEHLMQTLGELRRGDLDVRAERSGITELDDVAAAIDSLAAQLQQAQAEAVDREGRLAFLATSFETVARVGREVSGSLNATYVAMSIAEAASSLVQAPTTLWSRNQDRDFEVLARGVEDGQARRGDRRDDARNGHQRDRRDDRRDDARGDRRPEGRHEPSAVPVAVLQAAADARTSVAAGVRAYPLVLGGVVVGVLVVERERSDPDMEPVVEALLATAAAALESTKLHSEARELADVDALTRLPNRRRFEHDVDEEWQRCRRYGRPMSLVLLDLDHFKALNDQHGHLFGDEVLQGAAAAFAGALRANDTAYRYGGEEFVVLLRETSLEDAREVADRLRLAVASAVVPDHGVMVTASAGVAERTASMGHHTELVACADQALYAAKAAGRDQVVAAGL